MVTTRRPTWRSGFNCTWQVCRVQERTGPGRRIEPRPTTRRGTHEWHMWAVSLCIRVLLPCVRGLSMKHCNKLISSYKKTSSIPFLLLRLNSILPILRHTTFSLLPHPSSFRIRGRCCGLRLESDRRLLRWQPPNESCLRWLQILQSCSYGKKMLLPYSTAVSSDRWPISLVKLGSWFMVNEIISVTNTYLILNARVFYPSASHANIYITGNNRWLLGRWDCIIVWVSKGKAKRRNVYGAEVCQRWTFLYMLDGW